MAGARVSIHNPGNKLIDFDRLISDGFLCSKRHNFLICEWILIIQVASLSEDLHFKTMFFLIRIITFLKIVCYPYSCREPRDVTDYYFSRICGGD